MQKSKSLFFLLNAGYPMHLYSFDENHCSISNLILNWVFQIFSFFSNYLRLFSIYQLWWSWSIFFFSLNPYLHWPLTYYSSSILELVNVSEIKISSASNLDFQVLLFLLDSIFLINWLWKSFKHWLEI